MGLRGSSMHPPPRPSPGSGMFGEGKGASTDVLGQAPQIGNVPSHAHLGPRRAGWWEQSESRGKVVDEKEAWVSFHCDGLASAGLCQVPTVWRPALDGAPPAFGCRCVAWEGVGTACIRAPGESFLSPGPKVLGGFLRTVWPELRTAWDGCPQPLCSRAPFQPVPLVSNQLPRQRSLQQIALEDAHWWKAWGWGWAEAECDPMS